MMIHRSESASIGFLSLLVLTAVAFVSSGCGGDFSPTAPSLDVSPPVTSAAFGSNSTSVISGQLLSGGGSASSQSWNGEPSALTAAPASVANLQVSVNGTNVSTTTDTFGNFRLILVNTPSGNVMLRITGAGVNATVTVQVVGANKNVKVKIQVDGSSAQVVTSDVEDLGEFEGDVASVDLIGRSFTLEDGTVILVDDLTWWDSESDLQSLEEMAQAVSRGEKVEAEGRTVLTDAGLLIATIVKAETDDPEDKFKGIVVLVDRSTETMTLFDGTVVGVDALTEWDTDGDFFSFAELATAVEAGIFVEVEGEGMLQLDGSILAAEIEAKDTEFALEIEPEEWDVAWADGSSSGFVEARLEDGPFAVILASSIEMIGPNGTIVPVGTTLESKKLIANFTKVQAIGIVSGVAVGSTAEITVRGTLTDGTPWELTATIEVVDEIDDDDDDDDIDPEVIADAIEDLEDLIEEVEDLVDDGELGFGNGNALISKLQNAIKSLEKGNVTPAVNQIESFIKQVETFVKTGKLGADEGEDLIEAAEEIIDDLEA